MIPIESMYQAVHDSWAFRRRFRMKHRNRPLSREVIRQITDLIKRYVEEDAFPMPTAGTLQDFCCRLEAAAGTARRELSPLLTAHDAGAERYVSVLSKCYTGSPDDPDYDRKAAAKVFSYDRSRLLSTLEKLLKAARTLAALDIGAVRVRPCSTVRVDNLVVSILRIAARSVHIGRNAAPSMFLTEFMEGLFRILDIQVDDLPEMVKRHFDKLSAE